MTSIAIAIADVVVRQDSKGRATVSLATRKSGIVIEGREKGAESIERRKRIKGASQ